MLFLFRFVSTMSGAMAVFGRCEQIGRHLHANLLQAIQERGTTFQPLLGLPAGYENTRCAPEYPKLPKKAVRRLIDAPPGCAAPPATDKVDDG